MRRPQQIGDGGVEFRKVAQHDVGARLLEVFDRMVAPRHADRLDLPCLGHAHVVHGVADHHRAGGLDTGLLHCRLQHLRIGLAAIVRRRLDRIEPRHDAVMLEQRHRPLVALSRGDRENGLGCGLQAVQRLQRSVEHRLPRRRRSRLIVPDVALEQNVDAGRIGTRCQDRDSITRRDPRNRADRILVGDRLVDGSECFAHRLHDQRLGVDQCSIEVEYHQSHSLSGS